MTTPSTEPEIAPPREPFRAPTEPLLSPEFMRKLERWTFVLRRAASGMYGGERRSRRIGHSVEFADFRNYVPGDDLRFVDWDLYARLEKLYLKLFLQEQETSAHIILDLSGSMAFGSPSKALFARRLAAALGYIALFHQDGLSISIGSGSGEGPSHIFPLARGRGFSRRMLHFLSGAPEGGPFAFAPFVRRALSRIRRPGLVIFISDFMDQSGYEDTIREAVARRHEVIVIHTLDRADVDPDYEGDLKLIDAETGQEVEVSATNWALDAYRRRADAWLQGIADYCSARGVSYVRAFTDESAEDQILKSLRRLGRLG